MKIITFNARGSGNPIKWKSIRKIVGLKGAQMFYIQKTKKEVITKDLCFALWGVHDIQWLYAPSNGVLRGLLCIWNQQSVSLTSSFYGEGFVGDGGLLEREKL